jgi:glycerate kinase
VGRALVLSDPIGELTATEAAHALATGWSAHWQVAVVDNWRELPESDVVIVGCDHFDFVERGGELLQRTARSCLGRGVPCIVFARQVDVSLREMRTFGVEEAHRIPTDMDLTRAITDTARRIAAGWAS